MLQTGRQNQLAINDLSLFYVTFSLPSSLLMISPVALLAFSCLREIGVTDIQTDTHKPTTIFFSVHASWAIIMGVLLTLWPVWWKCLFDLHGTWSNYYHMRLRKCQILWLTSHCLIHCGKLLLKLDLCKCPAFCVWWSCSGFLKPVTPPHTHLLGRAWASLNKPHIDHDNGPRTWNNCIWVSIYLCIYIFIPCLSHPGSRNPCMSWNHY